MIPLHLAEHRAQPIALAAQHADVACQIVALGGDFGKGALDISIRSGRRLRQSTRQGIFQPFQCLREMLLGCLELRHAGLPFDHKKATISRTPLAQATHRVNSPAPRKQAPDADSA